MRSKFTPKQAAFIKWYVSKEVKGNGTEAARKAGYKGTEGSLRTIAKENITKLHIKAEIDKLTAIATKGADVTVESVLRQLKRSQALAEEAGQHGAAIRAAELQGKYLKMFVDRIEHVQVVDDVTTEQLLELIREIASADVDIIKLIAGNGAEDGDLSDTARDQTTH